MTVLSGLGTGVAVAATWNVDPGGGGDATTIQAAADLASDGDTLLVAPGTYTEEVFLFDSLTILGSGLESTVIDAGGDGFCVRSVAPPLTLEGLHLTGAVRTAYGFNGYGAQSFGPISVKDCLVDCEFGIDSRGDTEILRTTIRGSSGLRVEMTGPMTMVVEDTTFEECVAREPLGESIVHMNCLDGEPKTAMIRNSRFLDCQGVGRPIVGWQAPETLEITLQDCVFVGNDEPAAGNAPLAVVRHSQGGTVEPTVSIVGNTIAQSVGYSLGHPDEIHRLPPSVVVSRNAITGGAFGFVEPPGNLASVTSNLVWANGVNWTGPDRTGIDGNLSEEPKYCDAVGRDFTVASNSPLLPANNRSGVLIGAFGQGCGFISVEPSSWGGIKALYRGE